jgi:hypothetical protein
VRLWVGVVWGVGCHRGIEAAKLEVLIWEMITVMVGSSEESYPPWNKIILDLIILTFLWGVNE